MVTQDTGWYLFGVNLDSVADTTPFIGVHEFTYTITDMYDGVAGDELVLTVWMSI
jgi:hypothetical protein